MDDEIYAEAGAKLLEPGRNGFKESMKKLKLVESMMVLNSDPEALAEALSQDHAIAGLGELLCDVVYEYFQIVKEVEESVKKNIEKGKAKKKGAQNAK